MKKIQFLITLVVLFTISNSVFAQKKPKVIAVISKASWCPACVQNEGRVMKEVLPSIDSKEIQIVANDLSDAKTKEASSKQLADLGLNATDYNTTAVITFVDAKTLKKISTVNVSKSTAVILKSFKSSTK